MRLLALLLLLASAAPSARAATALEESVEGLARAADAVVRGVVERRESRWSGRRIQTTVEIRVTAAWRGNPGAGVAVRVPGGAVGDVAQLVPGAPTFAEGEEVVVFLGRTGRVHHVLGLGQGKFAVEGGVARPDLAGLRLARRGLPAGERRAEAMPLEELERRVRSAR